MRSRRVALLTGLAIVFLAAAAAQRISAAAPLDLVSCDIAPGARCGIFRVAEDPSRQAGRILSLKIVLLAARSPHPLDPVFILAGGPGQPATELAGAIAASWVTDEHAAVLMDVRGSDSQTGLDCPLGGEDFALDMAPLFSEGDDYWRTCRDALEKRADLRFYTSPRTVADLDDLRRALGYDKIDLYGGSFGTRLAIAYIHAHRAHVRAALLTGLTPLSDRAPLFHAQAAEAAFERLLLDCREDSSCHAAFPDVRHDFDEVLQRLRRAPAPVTIKSPVDGTPVEVSLTAPAFADSIRVMMYSLEGSRTIPLLLHGAAEGRLAPFAQAAVETGRTLRRSIRAGLTLSTSCPEDVARIRPEEIAPATAGSLIGDTRLRGQIAACRLWPQGAIPRSYFAPFKAGTATVLVSGERDPVTPARWGDEVRKSLPNSVHLVVRGGHAGVDSCVARIAAQVFRTGSVKDLDTGCIADTAMPPFVLDQGGAS